MKAASISEIKKQLTTLETGNLEEMCLKLARYKKENKELITYLLFEAHDEPAYVAGIKAELDDSFHMLPKKNVYYVKKSIRKIMRVMNRQIKYSDVATTELEVRLYFCMKIRQADVPLQQGTVLYNLYNQQAKKIQQIHSKLPEDLQFDYDREMKDLVL